MIAGLVVGVVAAAPSRADSPKPKPVTVPFELLKTMHMAVKVKINGKGPYRVIFDTGAPVTLLNNKIARESGVLPKDAKPPLFSLFGAMGALTIKTLALGELEAEKVPAIVMDHPALTILSRAFGPLDGIVGFPFFARYRMTLDYQAKELTFVPSGYQPDDVLQSMMESLLGTDKPVRRVAAPAAQWGLVVDKEVKDEEAGVTIKQVWPGTAAADADLKPGDRVLTIDSRWTDSVADCYLAASFIKPGQSVALVIRRDGKEQTLTVKPRAGL